jgi:thiosulfate/3-mercaptopyruvate sulfurtransferase
MIWRIPKSKGGIVILKPVHMMFCNLFLVAILGGCIKPTEIVTMPPRTDTQAPATKTQPLTSETLVPQTPSAEAVNIPPTYAHPEILTDASWVSDHLDDPTVRIVDARNPLEKQLYQVGHIPGAVYVDVFSDICCPSAIMSAESFEAVMSKLGIGDNTIVVIYDTDDGIWAARFWWALKYYGHDQAMLLNGGLNQWVYTGKPLETALPEVKQAVFHSNVQEEWKATIDEVRKAIDDPNVAILDSLPWPSYTGDSVSYARPGHIATALSFPTSNTVNQIFKTILPPSDLSSMLMRLKLDPGKRTITYCGGGIAGAHNAYVLYLMGFENVGLYDGSLMEWTSNPSNPMEVVP